jgi:hypothetical protein
MKTPSDRIKAIERNLGTLTIKALSLKLELSKGEFREEDHPRADDGKFGSGSGEPSDSTKETANDSHDEGYNEDKTEYKGFSVEEERPGDIRPPNEVTDNKKYKKLKESMNENGWQGRPIIVIDEGGSYYGLTGSHRLAAAQSASVRKIPVIIVPSDKLSEDELQGIVGGGGSEDYVLQGLRAVDLDKYADLVEEDLKEEGDD